MTRPFNPLLFSCCTLLLLACAACSDSRRANGDGNAASTTTTPSPAPSSTSDLKAPPADIVRASAEGLELRAGGAAEASVRLEIAGGYHINANPPTHPYLIPTQLDIAAQEGLSPGKPAYPQPLTKKFAFDPQPLAVYEGVALIKLPLRAEASATKGAHTLRAKLRVQPCDDNACYPPRTIETSIPVSIN
jgi:DsbC/DsbD-like thiol-disulfide interchange protein